MTITAAAVLYATLWFLCLFIALQVRITTQGEAGEAVDGTPSSAPASSFNLGRRLVWVTVATTILWAIIAGIIVSGVITIRDLDFFGRMNDGHY